MGKSFFNIILFLFVLPSISNSQSKLFISRDLLVAYDNGTRSFDGNPGENYWQNSADYKIKVYKELYEINSERFETNYNLGNLFGRYKNDIPKAIYYLNRAVKIDPNKAFALKDLGVAYGFQAKYDSSIIFLKKATELDPKDAQAYINIGVSYMNLNDKEKAQKYFNKAKEIDPNVQLPF